MTIKYVNSNGDVLNLLSDKIQMQEIESLFSVEWQYTSKDSNYFGGKVQRMYKGVQEKSFTISVFADDEEDFAEIMQNINDILFYDAMVKSSGKLWVNDLYLECYITSAEYSEYEDSMWATDEKFNLITTYPMWVNTKSFTLETNNNENVAFTNGVVLGSGVIGKYSPAYLKGGTDPGKIEYVKDGDETISIIDYSGDGDIELLDVAKIGNVEYVSKSVIYSQYVESEDKEDDITLDKIEYIDNKLGSRVNFRAEITLNESKNIIFLLIGEDKHIINYSFNSGDTVIIDTKEEKCLLVRGETETSIYGYSDIDNDIYKKIPTGKNLVLRNDNCTMNFTIYEESDAPLWK